MAKLFFRGTVNDSEFDLSRVSKVDLLPNDQAIDLSNCDREPIHVPGSIQPHGALLVLHETTLQILEISANSHNILGLEPRALLGKSISVLLEPDGVEQLREVLAQGDLENNPLFAFSLQPKGTAHKLDAVTHRHQGRVLLELEPQQINNGSSVDVRVLGASLRRLNRTDSALSFCQAAALEVQNISGFDRVMVYRFASDGSGEVIAEERRDDLEPFLGLHYPASDIPKQARALYVLNHLRLIADATYTSVPMLALELTEPLDMSYCFLRSVSPIHLEYLANMGVKASMSISIVRDGQLWGLIACHHYSGARLLAYNERAACEFLGQMVSLQLASKEQAESADYRSKLKSLSMRFLELIEREDDLKEALIQPDLQLLDYLEATGAAVVLHGEVHLLGKTPSSAQVQRLAEWLADEHAPFEIFATEKLSSRFAEAKAYQDVASGVLAVPVSRSGQDMEIWFRPEVPQTVTWGGDPNKPVTLAENGEQRLTPRKSFDAWREAVTGCAIAWKSVEIEAALELRRAVVSTALRRAEMLAGLNAELTRSNAELDSFAYVASHDLKEPLRGIHNYSTLLLEDAGDRLEPSERSKLETLVRLTQRMETLIDSLLLFSRVGRVDFRLRDCDLDKMVADVLDLLKPRLEQDKVTVRVPRVLPHTIADQARIGEVFNNLISNAIKYNDKTERWVEIGYQTALERQQLSVPTDLNPNASIFYVRDNGIGIATRHLENVFRIFKRLHARDAFGGGTGAGLTIARKIVERHGGQIWVESTPGAGSSFYFTLEG
jgi:two-component system, chemotaxis family, sensor kinase Cph1